MKWFNRFDLIFVREQFFLTERQFHETYYSVYICILTIREISHSHKISKWRNQLSIYNETTEINYRWELQNKQQATKELPSNLTLFWFISATAAVDITS